MLAAETNISNSNGQKSVKHLLSSRLGDDTLKFVVGSCSAEFDFYSSRTEQMALTQDLNNDQCIRGIK